MIDKTGFSLVEVIVASLLLAMITGGILSVALSSRKIVTLFHQRHSGYEVAKVAAEGLRQYMNYSDWINPGGPLAVGTENCYNVSDWNAPVDVAAYFGSSPFAWQNNAQWCYRIEDNPPYEYRKITINVTWDENFPD